MPLLVETTQEKFGLGGNIEVTATAVKKPVRLRNSAPWYIERESGEGWREVHRPVGAMQAIYPLAPGEEAGYTIDMGRLQRSVDPYPVVGKYRVTVDAVHTTDSAEFEVVA